MSAGRIYCVFSRNLPCLSNSESDPSLSFLPTQSTPTEVAQRDRLSDADVRLKIVDCVEVGMVVTTVTPGPGMPCASAVLLLAALLRVSAHFRYMIRTPLTMSATSFRISTSIRALWA